MHNKYKRIYLSSPTMHGKEMDYVNEAFESNWIAPLGPNVDAFEKEVAEYTKGDALGNECNVSGSNRSLSAAALNTGTAAIHLALKAAGVEKGDIVFCSSLTFSASCNPILYEGAIPVFIDSDEEDWNMSPAALEKAFERYPSAQAVIVVNLYGTPAKLDRIAEICIRYGAVLIEDAAESMGATYHGKQTGQFGQFGIFSFNGNKIITTSGGGMLISEDEEAIKKARFWATQSRENERHYEHRELGYNYRMSNVTAGIGRGQLLYLDRNIALKKNIYNQYAHAFADIEDIEMNPIPVDCEPNYWLSCITLKKDSKVKPIDIMLALEAENIEARPIWKPMHLQPVFSAYDFVGVEDREDSVAEDIFNRGVCLPSDIKNTDEDMDRIIAIIKGLFGCGNESK